MLSVIASSADRKATSLRKACLIGLLVVFSASAPLYPPAAQSPNTGTISQRGEEFVGPFPSWTNVKTVYGAVGDGVVDDTTALQAALSQLGQPGHSPVLFVPSGRYRITKTLMLDYQLFVSVIGEDPALVTIVWDGPVGGTMLAVNGVAYSRFTRLTYDGKGKASVAVEQSWDSLKPNFDTGNEYSDHVFVDVEYGIHGGFKGYGFAETSIVRSRFIRNTKAGIALGNFNALDVWIWYSTFEDCAIGVTNEPGAGNFRVYNSIFRGSTVADLYMKNTGVFSARANYSIGSKVFYLSAGQINHPAAIEIQGNTIVDPVDNVAIRLGNQGPGLIVDNIVRSRPRATAPVVVWRSFFGADVTSIGNVFTLADPVSNNGRLIAIDDRRVAFGMLNPAEPSMPPTLPNLGRPVFEVVTGSDTATIQRVLDTAAMKSGSRPVVHMPFGVYEIARTLTIPPSDLQLVGDGFRTVLKWTGANRGPLMRIAGPSKATIRELRVDGAAQADGIVVDTIDQSGSRVHLDGLQTRRGTESNLFVHHLANTEVELIDFGHAYSPQGVSVKVLGSTTTIFSGASSGNGLSYEVSEGAKVLLRDLWYEGDAPRGFAHIHGKAIFTIQGSRIASPRGGQRPAFSLADLDGRVSLLTNYIDDRISIVGNGGGAEVLGLGTIREHSETAYFTNSSVPSPAVLMAMTRQRTKMKGGPTLEVEDIGPTDAAFVRRMLDQVRQKLAPSPLRSLPPGISDVRMFRVWVERGLNNVLLTAGSHTPRP